VAGRELPSAAALTAGGLGVVAAHLWNRRLCRACEACSGRDAAARRASSCSRASSSPITSRVGSNPRDQRYDLPRGSSGVLDRDRPRRWLRSRAGVL
jgi:hypothetical protein